MKVPVLVESIDNHGFRATTGQPLELQAEGLTREDAIQHLHAALHHRLSCGAEIVALEVDSSQPSIAPYAGMFKDNPLFDAWQKAIAERRDAEDLP
jgi:hypothetical protein